MPIVVFASPKGGVGKSTSAVLLGSQLALSGQEVTIIDADPNKPVSRWSRTRDAPGTLRVIDDVTERTIIDVIEREESRSSFVIVDLEGTASRMVVYAISRADLVIIPSRGSLLDAVEAVSAIGEVRQQERAFRKHIKSVVLFTCTSAALRPRILTSLAREFEEHGTRVMNVQLHDRDAFRALFGFGGTLHELDPNETRNIPSAVANAQAFTDEVLAILAEKEA